MSILCFSMMNQFDKNDNFQVEFYVKYKGVSKSFRTELIMKSTTTVTINTH
jgi:hypothetical protein